MIGQAAEFDYSGTQACRVLMDEGYEVVLVNSNPATIMTDPEVATTTYIEPLLPGPVRQVIERERPDALLPTLGGQTALNLAKALHEDGTLESFGVELIGADYEAIDRAEDRERFRETMTAAGLRVPRSAIAHTPRRRARGGGRDRAAVHRPPGVHARRHRRRRRPDESELERVVGRGLAASPIGQVLLEESVLGWGEFELEVMRDRADNVVIICSIENLDPMGVHTGDSVCVAPQQTLTDKQYQALRDQAIAVIRAVGVETGGSNVQFAVNRATDEIVVIEMNPRVSRSSALASKATGFPIAKIAARLAVGYTLQEIPNDITRATPGQLRAGDRLLRGQVAAVRVREVPRRRRRADHAHEVGRRGDGDRAHVQAGVRQGAALARARPAPEPPADDDASCWSGRRGRAPERFDHLLEALRRGAAVEETARPHRASTRGSCTSSPSWSPIREAPFAGERTFKSVDTCAAEFAAQTPYYYSGWERAGRGGPAHEVERGERRERRDPRLGPEPDRPGDRVRLLLRARRRRPCVSPGATR